MLAPGRIYVNDTKRLAMNFQDDDGTDIDPDTLTLKLMSPSGTVTTAVYGTDAALVRLNTGDYYVDVVPNESGRWHWRWISTGANTATATEGTFVVQWSEIEEGIGGGSSVGVLVTPDETAEIEELT